MNDFLRDFLFRPLKDYIGGAAMKASSQVKESLEVFIVRSTYLVSEVVPAAAYTALFFSAGAIIIIIGMARAIDQFSGIAGLGEIAGGIILIVLGIYFKGKVDAFAQKL